MAWCASTPIRSTSPSPAGTWCVRWRWCSTATSAAAVRRRGSASRASSEIVRMVEGAALIAAAGLMGLAGLPHCAAMCAAPCAAVTGRGAAAQPLFQVSRVAGYAIAGAVAAAGVAALREGLAFTSLLRPLWTLLHLLALTLGLWMLWRGQWPAWLQRDVAAPAHAGAGWQRIVVAPARSAAAGALWIAWPCALSQSALLVAALGSTPQQGAAAMAAFAIASSPA